MAGQSNLLQNRHFINNTSTAMVEALLGIACSNTCVGIFDFAKTVVRRDYDTMEEVKILSGGPSGHEPAFAGFVGKGMLTAAVQGDIYVSPSSIDILRTIQELSDEKSLGVLVIIPNSSGDRLNFGLAVERAQNMGIHTELVLVTDDCCCFTKPRDKRGLTGAFLVQKVAGALAQQGRSLQEISAFCTEFQKDIYSLSVSIKACTNVEKGTCDTCKFVVAKTELEIGAGLHGEPGTVQMSLTAVEHACKMIFEQMTNEHNEHHLIFEPDVPVALMINNLGLTSKLEEYILTKEILKYLLNINVKVIRLFSGSFLSAIDKHGFTITILNIKHPDILTLLDEKCEAPSWRPPTVLDLTNDSSFIIEGRYKPTDTLELRGPRLSKRQSNTLLLVTQFACDALISCEKQLNIIDAETGNGDSGTRMRRGVEAINNQLRANALNLNFPFVYLMGLGNVFEKATGGTVGCLYGIMFEAAAKEFKAFPDQQLVDGWAWLHALQRAVNALSVYAGVSDGDNTVYDPLWACVKAMEDQLNASVHVVEAFGIGVQTAEEVTQKTRYYPKKYPDPGAHAVSIWLRALYEGVKLRVE